MTLFRGADVPLRRSDSHTFVGDAHVQRVASGGEGVPVVVYRVEFEDGARTNWHIHSGAQWLMILEGRIRVQKWGEPVQDAVVGDAVLIAPGEKHWHGAEPGGRAVHLAINVDAATEWLEPVSSAQYAGSVI